MAAWLFAVQMNLDRWLAVVGIATGALIGIIGIVLAVYYAKRAEKKRGPTFVVSPKKLKLSSGELYTLNDFKVTYKDSAVGKHDLTEILVHFFNSGNLPILTEEVLIPFEIKFPAACLVLDCAVIKQNREITGLTASIGSHAQSVLLDFALLEPNDGGTVRIVYDGPAEGVAFTFKGSCLGASSPTVLPSDIATLQSVQERLKGFAVIVGSGCLFVGGATITLFGLKWLASRIFSSQRVGDSIVLGVLGLCFFVVVGNGIWSLLRWLTVKGVPSNIR